MLNRLRTADSFDKSTYKAPILNNAVYSSGPKPGDSNHQGLFSGGGGIIAGKG